MEPNAMKQILSVNPSQKWLTNMHFGAIILILFNKTGAEIG